MTRPVARGDGFFAPCGLRPGPERRVGWLLVCVLLFSLAVPCAAEPVGPRVQEVFIPMPDGVRLAADLYLPADAKPGDRFPVLLEYLPYRKDESRPDRYGYFAYFVDRGFAVARVDIRGTGRSEGRLVEYEYSDRELQDGDAVIDWLSKQPFSTGKVGMFGISWGSINSINMAMRRPPALKAIIAVMAADDLYGDDVHFTDGIMRIDAYELGIDLWNSLPGAPDYRIDEDYFRNRFDTTPWLLVYKRQQRDGPFWYRASLKRDYGLIQIPTFVIGGWFDGYRDSVPRMLQHMQAPVKAILGPWNHTWPHEAVPPPAIEWRAEAVRWFDHWLKGVPNGIMDEPRFSVYMRDWYPPGVAPDYIPGEWISLEGWPESSVEQRAMYLQADHRLTDRPSRRDAHQLRYVPSTGPEASGSVMWWGDWAPDQRAADTYSLVYDSEPLPTDLDVLGFPHALLEVSSDAPLADWIARLSDVAPDGRVTQVSGGAINAAQRDSAESPQPLEPGRKYALDVDMRFSSWRFPKGHRIRLAINNSQWPMFWPTPYPMTTTLHLGGSTGSRLSLPVLGSRPDARPEFRNPEAGPKLEGYASLPSETVSDYAEISTVVRDQRAETTELTATNSGGASYPWGSTRYTEEIIHRVSDSDPARTGLKSRYTITVELPGRELTWEGLLDFHSDAEAFHYSYTRRLLRGSQLVREKNWQEIIPRDLQ